MNKARSGQQKLFSDGSGLIYPDFIGKNSANRIIVDAKYKPIRNIASGDYLQVLAYMFRFEAKWGYYIYPDMYNSNIKELMLNQGVTFENSVNPRENIGVKKVGLSIPCACDNYQEFVNRIQKSEEKLKQYFKEDL